MTVDRVSQSKSSNRPPLPWRSLRWEGGARLKIQKAFDAGNGKVRLAKKRAFALD